MIPTFESLRRACGVRRVIVQCNAPFCHHSAALPIDRFPAGATCPGIARRMVCTRCGAANADVRPDYAGTPAMPNGYSRA